MRALIFADLQADEGAQRLRQQPALPLQRWRVQQFYRWASALVHRKNLNAVWDLGDTTHDRSAVAHPTVQAVTLGCAELTAGLAPLFNYKLLGNHEQHLKNGQTHVGGLFQPYFHVIPDRAVFTLPAERLHVVCASYPADPVELSHWLKETLSSLRARDSTMRILVLGHFTVQGAQMGTGVAAHGVPREALHEADCILLGHVHRRQALPGGLRGWYVGSPFQQDFGEAHDPAKCVALLDTETLTVEWVPTLFPVYRTVGVAEVESASRSNDVLRVLVRSTAEAQKLYASACAGTVEPIYAFTGEEGPSPAAGALDFAALTRAYTATTPLPGTTAEELLTLVTQFQ